MDPMTDPYGFPFHLEEAGWTSQGVHYNDRVITSHNPCIYMDI